MTLTITLIIVLATTIISLMAFSNNKIIDDLIFYPPAISRRKQWYRFFSSGLIHADAFHLIFNMLSLYMFGGMVEAMFTQIFGHPQGKLLYLLMYVLALPVSLLPTWQKNKDNYHYRSLGASGAVSAVIFAGLLVVPYIKVGLFLIPPFIPGFIFAPLYLLLSIYLEKRGGDNINHSAHIWGAVFGMLFVIVGGKLLANFNAIEAFINGVKYYLRTEGWM